MIAQDKRTYMYARVVFIECLEYVLKVYKMTDRK